MKRKTIDAACRKKKRTAASDLAAMILCGGQGTRLREVTELLPKPMVPIGDQPILWHIMKCYAAFGVRRFILCLGYKHEEFIDFFMNFHLRTTDATITLGHNPRIRFHGEVDESDWEVTLAQTGIESCTGRRIEIASKYLKDSDEDFFLTYGDGLADVDFEKLYACHAADGRLLTVTAVHPPGRFGEIVLKNGSIQRFSEKPLVSREYINGGFMVMKREFIHRYLASTGDVYLEAKPFSEAVCDRNVNVWAHEGFWQCMDTPREHALLNKLWRDGPAPWTKYWK